MLFIDDEETGCMSDYYSCRNGVGIEFMMNIVRMQFPRCL
jgi:hypothetical protein